MTHWHLDESDIDESQVSSVPSSDFFALTDTADERPQLSPISTQASLTGADPPLTWHTLNSFLPIFELLGPKFVWDQDAYYIHGLVDDNELGILRSYSSMVTEFILTDFDLENVKPIIAPSTFFHIAQFLEPNSGLMPSLLRLRIIRADTYFAYLHLLHTPTLKTLEVTNVPDHQHPTFFSFLTTLVHRAPLLEDVILGPGRFPLKSLQAILKFTNLHQLDLRDAASTIDFTFLQDIGALPNLESFILDARSCKYIARIPEEQSESPPTERTEAGSQTPKPFSDTDGDGPSRVYSPCLGSPIYEDKTEVRSQTPKLSSDINSDGPSWSSSCPSSPTLGISGEGTKEVDHLLSSTYNQTSCGTNSISSGGGFYQLKIFHFVGGLRLIRDIIPYIASSTLEDVSITVIRLSPQDLRQEAEIEAEKMRQVEAEERRRKIDQETEQRIMEKVRRFKRDGMKLGASSRQAILDEAETQWKKQEAQYQEIEAREAQNRAQAIFDRHTALYITVLQTVSSRWSANLKTVKFNQLDGSSQPLSIPPVLPKQVYEILFCHPKIEILEFKRWKLDSVNDFLFSLKTSSPKNLEHLHLPIDDPDSSVSLSGLLDIAEACPMLESLHCCISTLPPIPQHSIPTTKALSHGLQTLFVTNNPTSLWDFNQLLLVARHLYLTFPRLQTIDNVEGPNAEQWVRIRDLVKIFQVIREDDVYRFSVS